MSGGHYHYAYNTMRDCADMMQDDVRQYATEHVDRWGDTRNPIPPDEPTFAERMTQIEIEDQAAGEYVVVSQCTNEHGEQRIAIGAEEWTALREAIDAALAECRDFGEPK